MKYTRKNKLARSIVLGMIHSNGPTTGATFAGVPGNFTFTGGGNNANPNAIAPINPGAVPNHQAGGPGASKINPGTPSTSTADPNSPHNPNNPSNVQPKAGSSVLDIYSGLFENKPQVDDKGQPIKPAPTILDAGLENFSNVAKSIKFNDIATPDQMALMAKGGQEGVAAMMEVMQDFGRQVFAHATTTATSVTKKGIELKSGETTAAINNAIRLHGVSESLLNKDPRLSNPAVAPLVSVVQQQIASKFPGDTVAQLEQKVVQYFESAFGGFGTDPNKVKVPDPSEEEFDFLKFLKS